jgi:putative dimethyl sulfoxide reductase chaperone
MRSDLIVSNGTGASNGSGAGSSPAGPFSGGERFDGERPATETIATAADLLSHFWSRPIAEELEGWLEARELTAELHRLISSDPQGEPVGVPEGNEALALLDEYERLFVGPGQVPCPPYESFWREDVPVDIRRTLMGPCTTELRGLYLELGLKVAARSGELPDHVGVELEALAFALSLEATGPVARRLSEEHLFRFLPRFCRAVAHDAELSFYRDLAAMTLDWLEAIKAYFATAD